MELRRETDHFAAVNAIKAYLPHPDLCKELFEIVYFSYGLKVATILLIKPFKWGLRSLFRRPFYPE